MCFLSFQKRKSLQSLAFEEDTKDQPWGFARDMQWGQGLQLIEDFDAANAAGIE